MMRHSRHWRHSPSQAVTNPPLYPPCYTCDAVTVVVMAGNERLIYHVLTQCRRAERGA